MTKEKISCGTTDCLFNRTIRKDWGVCKRDTISIGQFRDCLDYFKNPKKNHSE